MNKWRIAVVFAVVVLVLTAGCGSNSVQQELVQKEEISILTERDSVTHNKDAQESAEDAKYSNTNEELTSIDPITSRAAKAFLEKLKDAEKDIRQIEEVLSNDIAPYGDEVIRAEDIIYDKVIFVDLIGDDIPEMIFCTIVNEHGEANINLNERKTYDRIIKWHIATFDNEEDKAVLVMHGPGRFLNKENDCFIDFQRCRDCYYKVEDVKKIYALTERNISGAAGKYIEFSYNDVSKSIEKTYCYEYENWGSSEEIDNVNIKVIYNNTIGDSSKRSTVNYPAVKNIISSLEGSSDFSAKTFDDAIKYLEEGFSEENSEHTITAETEQISTDTFTNNLTEELQSDEILVPFLARYCFCAGNQIEYNYIDAEREIFDDILAVNPGYSIADWRNYPLPYPEAFWQREGAAPDPHGVFIDYYKTDAEAVKWIASNIFNVSEEIYEDFKKNGSDNSQFMPYYLDGYFYSGTGGVGGPFPPKVVIHSAEKKGSYYYVQYSLVNEIGEDTEIMNYVVLRYKDIEGANYWSIYTHSKKDFIYVTEEENINNQR